MACLAHLLWAATPQEAFAEGGVEDLLAMIRVTRAGSEDIGAGIVIGSSLGRLYVVTARHVVVDQDAVASKAHVMLRFLGERLTAKVLGTQSRDLDLAVLKVEASGSLVDHVNSLPFAMFASSARRRRLQDRLSEGKQWFRDFREDKVREVRGDMVVVQAETVPGYSGGVFVDREDRIIGMIRQTRDQVTFATTADAVLSQLNALPGSLAAARTRPGAAPRNCKSSIYG